MDSHQNNTDNCLWTPDKCTKFQLDWSTGLQATAIFFKCAKTQRKKLESLPTHISETLCVIFFKFGV